MNEVTEVYCGNGCMLFDLASPTGNKIYCHGNGNYINLKPKNLSFDSYAIIKNPVKGKLECVMAPYPVPKACSMCDLIQWQINFFNTFVNKIYENGDV